MGVCNNIPVPSVITVITVSVKVLWEIVIECSIIHRFIVYNKLLQCVICYNTFRYTLPLKLLTTVSATLIPVIGIGPNNSGIMVQNNQEITGKRGRRVTFPYEKTPLLQNIKTGKTVGELVDGNYLIIR
jgi:hypothetical protein